MTEDLRRAFEKALPDSLPAAEWDSHDMERRAQRSIRRQRIGYAASALCLVAAVSVALPAVLPETPPQSSATTPTQQTEYPLPELKDGESYVWGGEEDWSETKESQKVNKAFWDHMSTLPGLRMVNGTDDSDSGPVTQADVGQLVRVESQLFTKDEVRGKHPVLDDSGEPYYRPNYAYPANSDAGHSKFRFDGSTNDDRIEVRVHPKDSFVTGRPDQAVPHPQPGPSPQDPEYLAESCESFTWEEGTKDEFEATYECDKKTVTKGVALTTERTESQVNGVTTVSRNVVLYRHDGTAIVVRDEPTMDSNNVQATLDTDALIGIAEAIPDVDVK